MITMRSEDEIARAHDLLVGICVGDAPHPCPKHKKSLQAALDVLCWVLRHDHNTAFEMNLRELESILAEAGYRLVKPGSN